MSDPLTLLKEHLEDAKLLASGTETSHFSQATDVAIGGQTFSLSTPTIYVLQGKGLPLGECYFAWVNRTLQRTDFIELAEQQGVKPLGFLQRSDLCDWLEGNKNELEFSEKVQEEDTVSSAQDPLLSAVLSQERHLVDHNTSLRGTKSVDFSSVADSCKRTYLQQSKSEKKHQQKPAGVASKRPRNPIMLISPSASAVLTMANVKTFLEKGHFVNALSNTTEDQQYLSSNDLAMVTHVFPKIGKVTFMCVDNTDKFSREEHWDRTVAVFTTGQKWQFKNYRWPEPADLFHNVKGYYFHFEKDPIPPTCLEWNVERIGIDKQKRFKDAVVLNHFWDSVERAMIAKGWNK